MKMLKIALAATAFTAMTTAANAQDSGLYVNAGIDAVEFEAYTISGKVGYHFNEYFALEGQLGFGISDESEDFDEVFDIDDFGDFDDIDDFDDVDEVRVSGSVSAGIDNTFAGFAKFAFPISDQVDIFARAGYHFTQIGVDVDDLVVTVDGTTVSLAGAGGDVDTDGIALGAGGQYMFNELNGVRLEYTYLDIDEVDGVDISGADFGDVGSNVVSLSYVRKF